MPARRQSSQWPLDRPSRASVPFRVLESGPSFMVQDDAARPLIKFSHPQPGTSYNFPCPPTPSEKRGRTSCS
jgi:hypothetical protein